MPLANPVKAQKLSIYTKLMSPSTGIYYQHSNIHGLGRLYARIILLSCAYLYEIKAFIHSFIVGIDYDFCLPISKPMNVICFADIHTLPCIINCQATCSRQDICDV